MYSIFSLIIGNALKLKRVADVVLIEADLYIL